MNLHLSIPFTDDSFDVHEKFIDYAIEQGWVKDSPEARQNVTVELLRGDFRNFVAATRAIGGFDVSANLLEHSLQDRPKDLVFTDDDEGSTIFNSSEFRTVKTKVKNELNGLSSGTTKHTVTGSVTLKSTRDLHLAYNKMSYTVTCTKVNGKWQGSYHFKDTYDFDKVAWNYYKSSYSSLMVTVLNNYADLAQKIGAIVPYDITVTAYMYNIA